MFHPRVLFRALISMLALVLLLGGCSMPAHQEETPAPTPAEPPVAEPAQEAAAEDLMAIVTQNANVRSGPGTDYPVAFWLTTGDEVTVVGRNVDGSWLQIEHEDRPGWIFGALTDTAAEAVTELPADAPPPRPAAAPTPEPEPTIESEPAPETVEPAPELPALSAPAERVTVTVTGSVVNLRRGPGTDYATDGQVREGDQMHVTGRNAVGDWLQVMHPVATGKQVWIYGPLTDIDATATATLTVAETVEVEVEVESTPAAPPPTPVAVAEPAPTPVPGAGKGRSGGMGGAMAIGGRGGATDGLLPEAGGTANPNNKPLPLMYFEDYGVNPFVDADEDPLSTFALDGDTASYAVARRYLRDGWLPNPESVRTEEYVNAFGGGYRPSTEGLSLHLDAAPAPFAPEGYVLLRVGVAASAFPEERDPVSLIFIVDVSGSMEYDNRLGAAKRVMLGLLEQSHPADQAALVTYRDWAEVLKPFSATEDSPDLEQAIRSLQPSGSTYAEAGLRLAYELAAAHDMQRGRDVRLVLFSDGVGNVGETGPDEILELVDEYAQRRATLTTVGVGLDGNYNDVMMERLANRGNGTYHYIEDRAAEEAFLEGPAQAVFHETARDARIQVEFNPENVRKYRLLGYENRAKADDTFRDDTEDFGEIGFRSDVTALYEVRPLDGEPKGWLATARLRYRDLQRAEVVEVAADIAWDQVGEMDRYFQRQAAVAEWAELLGKSFYAQCGSIEAVLDLLPVPWDDAGEELNNWVWATSRLFEPFCEK